MTQTNILEGILSELSNQLTELSTNFSEWLYNLAHGKPIPKEYITNTICLYFDKKMEFTRLAKQAEKEGLREKAKDYYMKAGFYSEVLQLSLKGLGSNWRVTP